MSDELLAAIHSELLEQKGTLSSLSADMKTLVGNGKSGRIDKIEDDVDGLKAAKNYVFGFGAGLIFLEGAFHYVLHKVGLK